MALLVQKFGGTSVGRHRSPSTPWPSAVAGFIRGGHQVLVVVSAMAGETDRLEALGQSVAKHQDPREMDVLLSAGEQASIALVAMALTTRGCKARSWLGAPSTHPYRCESHEGPHRGD